MDLITVEQVIDRLDAWIAQYPGPKSAQ